MASIGRNSSLKWLLRAALLLACESAALRQLNFPSANAAQEPSIDGSDRVHRTAEEGGAWHLILLVQGLPSNDTEPSTMSLLAQDLSLAVGDARIVVAVIEPNSSAKPLPSLVQQGEVAADEVTALLEKSAQNGRHIAEYSVIGHSLGGLVARVMAKRLARSRPELVPRTFASLFTPHVGLPDSVASKLAEQIGPSGTESSGLHELLELTGNGVLAQLAAGEYLDALRRFRNRVLYGATNDWQLDYQSATLSASAPPETPKAIGSSLGLNLRTVAGGAARCGDVSPRSLVLCALSTVPFRRVALEWSRGRPGVAARMELLRDLLPDLNGGSLPGRGQACSSGSTPCARGLQCLEDRCLPAYFSKDEMCTFPFTSAQCGRAVKLINAVTHEWHIVVTSSGGGGHIAAANNLREIIGEKLLERHSKAVSALNALRGLLSPAVFSQLHDALLLAGDEPPHVQVMDIMKSNCMSIDGKGNLFMGDWMAAQWNDKQRAGDVEGMKHLIELQPITQVLLGKTCEKFLEDYLTGDSLGFREPPVGLHSTQPLFVESLTKAAEKLHIPTLNIYATDLPTPQCVHFFHPLKAFVKRGRGSRIIFHTVMPREGLVEAEKLSGLPAGQIAIEPFMPVNPTFMRSAGLPLPGQATGLLLKAQSPAEERFLATLGNPLLVEAHDEVALVMLGSQPTVSALRSYGQEFLRLPGPAAGPRAKRYVYIGCGSADNEEYAAVYADLVIMAKEAKANRSRTVLVPFTGQDAKAVFGRADVAITRSGGMTSGEILALRGRRGDEKRILLHVEPVTKKVLQAAEQMVKMGFHETVGKRELSVWAMAALGWGMVPWEAGNARFLVDKVGAQLVGPERLVETWAQPSMLFKDGDARAPVAQSQEVEACPEVRQEGCEKPEMEPLPVPVDEVAQGNLRCALALAVFRNAGLAPTAGRLGAGAHVDVRLDAHRCRSRSKLVVVRQKDDNPTPSYLTSGTSINRAAEGAAAACGAKVLSCGEMVAIVVNATL